MRRIKWTEEADSVIQRQIGGKSASINWEDIRLKLETMGFAKTKKQIQIRWFNHLSPAVIKRDWSDEESRELFRRFREHGFKWKKIAAHFRGRSDNCVKNRFFCILRKVIRVASKLTQIDFEESITSVVNGIRPKVLAECVSRKISLDINRKSVEVDLVELVGGYGLGPLSRLSSVLTPTGKLLICKLVWRILEMNESYTRAKSKTRRRKRIRKAIVPAKFEEKRISDNGNNLNAREFSSETRTNSLANGNDAQDSPLESEQSIELAPAELSAKSNNDGFSSNFEDFDFETLHLFFNLNQDEEAPDETSGNQGALSYCGDGERGREDLSAMADSKNSIFYFK